MLLTFLLPEKKHVSSEARKVTVQSGNFKEKKEENYSPTGSN